MTYFKSLYLPVKKDAFWKSKNPSTDSLFLKDVKKWFLNS